MDRREDEGNFELGDNRVQAQALNAGRHDSPFVPIKPKEQLRKDMDAQGVIVMVDSPGPEEFLQVMFERIWGIE